MDYNMGSIDGDVTTKLVKIIFFTNFKSLSKFLVKNHLVFLTLFS
jgi:hypothetical protein